MGQCTSRKAASAFAASATAAHKKSSSAMHKHQIVKENPDEAVPSPPSKGVAMSFGFKKRPATAPIIGNANAARRLANSDIDNNNGTNESEPLTANAVPSGRTTPRLVPPKKEPNATRVSRFGFRQPNAHRLNKVADLNTNKPPATIDSHNNNYNNNNTNVNVSSRDNNKVRFKASATTEADKNKTNATRPANNHTQIGRYTLQTTNLPKPELPVLETKTAKTLANRKIATKSSTAASDEASSKDASTADDSGVESHSSHVDATNALREIEILDGSPNWHRNHPRPRNLTVVVSGNTFDLTDLEESSETHVQLPQLPSAFAPQTITTTSGLVRERTLQYQRQIDSGNKVLRVRKISITSSEGCSDYGEEEKTFRDKFRTEKSYTTKTFLKTRAQEVKASDSSPPSSDDQEWLANGGEAMADAFSISFSSSDESRCCKDAARKNSKTAFHDLMAASVNDSFVASDRTETKNVSLIIEDSKFAALAAASTGAHLLEDEPSPVDSLICSFSENEDFAKKINNNNGMPNNNANNNNNNSSSNSKDVNEKSPSTPGTPTNASNSLSLSDGKDYFDDEIADQPGLIFDDTPNACNSDTASSRQRHHSETSTTLVEAVTPKPRRRNLSVEHSPLSLRNKKILRSHTGSIDTLSPCESIASDDLMLDFDLSQGSGLDDFDRVDRIKYTILDEDSDDKKSDSPKYWQMSITSVYDKASPSNLLTRNSRLLRSRAGTPNSMPPDSPRSLDGRNNMARTRSSAAQSPLRLPKGSTSSIGYDSDDSLRIDRASHGLIMQDVMGIKTMLLKLKRVLHEQADEDYLMRSETHNPLDLQNNGLFNGLGSDIERSVDPEQNTRLELEDLRRQVLFLQGQLEDKERTVQMLHEEIAKSTENRTVNDAMAIVSNCNSASCTMSNAATQTERLRPISTGPSLLQSSPTTDGNVGSLVSVTDSSRKRSDKLLPATIQTMKIATAAATAAAAIHTNRLWRIPGEPPMPSYINNNSSNNGSLATATITSVSIPKRSTSKTRVPVTPS